MADFNADLTELQRYAHWISASDKQTRAAISMTINSIAFDARRIAPQIISRELTVRNKRFVESSFRVEKATASSLIAWVGSVRRDRFTGWAEQEGERSTRRRTPTIAARSGSFKNQMKLSARLKSGNKFYRPEQFQAPTLKRQFGFMMRVLGSRGGGDILIGNEITTRRGLLRKGLYEFKNHRIRRLQDTAASNAQPARRPWMNQIIAVSATQGNIERAWAINLDRILNGAR